MKQHGKWIGEEKIENLGMEIEIKTTTTTKETRSICKAVEI